MISPFRFAQTEKYLARKGIAAAVLPAVCESTMHYARENPVKKDTLYIAETQAGGKGRNGRPFLSAPGGLYMSLTLYRSPMPNDLNKYPLLTGLAVASALRDAGVDARLKWPNDVYVADKKICGILLTAHTAEQNIVAGIGVNVKNDISALKEIATSTQILKIDVERETLAAEIAAHFFSLEKLETAEIIARYKPLCNTLGTRITCSETGEAGEAVDIDAQGFLLLKTEAGIKRILNPIH